VLTRVICLSRERCSAEKCDRWIYTGRDDIPVVVRAVILFFYLHHSYDI